MIIERRKASKDDDLAEDFPVEEWKPEDGKPPAPSTRKYPRGTMPTTNPDSNEGAATGGQGSVPEDTAMPEGKQSSPDTSSGYGQDTRR